jgi:hypothetical protein
MALGSGGFAAVRFSCIKRDTHDARPYHAAMKDKTILQYIHDGSVGILVGFDSFDCLVVMRIEWLAGGGDALKTMASERIP